MSWKLGEVTLDYVQRARIVHRRLEKVIDVPFKYPMVYDWGRRVTSLLLEGWVKTSTRDNLLDQERKKQPICLFAPEPYGGKYIVRGFDFDERGGIVNWCSFRTELFKLKYGNLALFSPVTACGTSANYSPNNVVDDDLATTWRSDATSGELHWIYIDLAEDT